MRDDDEDDMTELLQRRRERKRQARQLRIVIGVVGLLLFVFACASIAIAIKGKRGAEIADARNGQMPPAVRDSATSDIPPLRSVSCKFGEWINSGGLHVRVLGGQSNAHIQGVRGGDRRDLLVLWIEAKNVNPGKIVEWSGWQNKGEVEDEFGNKFKPAEGWGFFANESQLNDFPNRIPPTQNSSIIAVLYYERVPHTSKMITVALPFAGTQVRFQGKHNDPW